jgi:hypothetical protein
VKISMHAIERFRDVHKISVDIEWQLENGKELTPEVVGLITQSQRRTKSDTRYVLAYDGTGIFAISDDSGTEVVVTFLRLGEYQQQVLFRLIGYVRQDSPQGSPKTPKAAKRRAGPAKTSPGIDKVALLKKELANAQRGADRQRKALRAAGSVQDVHTWARWQHMDRSWTGRCGNVQQGSGDTMRRPPTGSLLFVYSNLSIVDSCY